VATSVYSRTFQKAAELIGGHAKLCRHLRVPEASLQRWIDDKEVPPVGIFLKAVDYIIDETPTPGSSDPGDPPTPRSASSSEDSSSTWC
jgi:hypothetical protein